MASVHVQTKYVIKAVVSASLRFSSLMRGSKIGVTGGTNPSENYKN